MKICFVVELPNWESWDDGLRGAMRIIEKKHEVCYHLNGDIEHEWLSDVILAWGGTLSKSYENIQKYECPKILLFAGGPIGKDFFTNYNLVCFENNLHTLHARSLGIDCMSAFGTNTQVFKPMRQPKMFDVIYPGAFGRWKRKDLFARATKGLRSFTCGNIQPHEIECWDVCVENGIAVSADIPQARLPYFMAMSETLCVLPVAEIGGQRTVLEGMAMKMPVIVPSDAPLVLEFARYGGMIIKPNEGEIREAIKASIGRVNREGYEYVMNNYTEEHYASRLRIAIDRVV